MIYKAKKLLTTTYLTQFSTTKVVLPWLTQLTMMEKSNPMVKEFLIPLLCVLLIKVNKLNLMLLCGIKSHKGQLDLKNFDLALINKSSLN
jgi:hypothetical protein